MLTAHKAREKMMAGSGVLTVIEQAIETSCNAGNTRAIIHEVDKHLNIRGPKEDYVGQQVDRQIAVANYLIDLGYEVNFEYNHQECNYTLVIEWQKHRPILM